MHTCFFTGSDRQIIMRAALVAERLTERYFDLREDEWVRNPYGVYTQRDVHESLHEPNVFANVVMYGTHVKKSGGKDKEKRFGIILQDPNILLALLRSSCNDLWTLGLYILTHELVHITRFRKYGVDFFADVAQRDKEEQVVHEMTRDILRGTTPLDYVLELYDKQVRWPISEPPLHSETTEVVKDADLRVSV